MKYIKENSEFKHKKYVIVVDENFNQSTVEENIKELGGIITDSFPFNVFITDYDGEMDDLKIEGVLEIKPEGYSKAL